MNKPLANQTAIITGAARGIGATIARFLAKHGANIAINDIESPAETVTACQELGVKAISLVADIRDQSAVESMVAETRDTLGPISIVISNAAYSDREVFYSANMAGFQRTIDVSMWGAYYLLRAASNQMIETQTQGSMVVIGSPHAFKAIPGACAYNMAKGAIDQLARTAACELAKHRIRVNIIHPGWTDTPGERKFFHENELTERGSNLPLGRMATSEDIARGVIFLCDPASSYITGTTLTIDGGSSLPHDQMFRIENRPS